MKWQDVFNMLAPSVLGVVSAAKPEFTPFASIILAGAKEAQALPGATGQEKKDHVLALVGLGASAANATGKTHIDVRELLATASAAIDTTIKAVNVVHNSHGTR